MNAPPVHPLPPRPEPPMFDGAYHRLLDCPCLTCEADRATTPPPVRVVQVQREWGITDSVLALQMGLAVREMEMLKRGFVYQTLPVAAFHLARLALGAS